MNRLASKEMSTTNNVRTLVYTTICGFGLLVLLYCYTNPGITYKASPPMPTPILKETSLPNSDKPTNGSPVATSVLPTHQSPNTPTKPHLWSKDVHLCIMFNLAYMKPNPQVITILLSQYIHFFDHITLIFDGKWEHKPEYVPDNINFSGCESHLGWYQNKCLNICINQFDNSIIKGHLYLADDIFVNLNKMGNLDSAKVWFCHPDTLKFSNILKKSGLRWHWWGPNGGNNVDKLIHVMESLHENWKHNLVQNAGFPDKFEIHYPSDLIYIPTTFVSNFTEVLTHLIQVSPELFCEVAIPLSVGIIVNRARKVLLNNIYLWGADRNVNRLKHEADLHDFVHPMKLSVPAQAHLWQSLMEAQWKDP